MLLQINVIYSILYSILFHILFYSISSGTSSDAHASKYPIKYSVQIINADCGQFYAIRVFMYFFVPKYNACVSGIIVAPHQTLLCITAQMKSRMKKTKAKIYIVLKKELCLDDCSICSALTPKRLS